MPLFIILSPLIGRFTLFVVLHFGNCNACEYCLRSLNNLKRATSAIIITTRYCVYASLEALEQIMGGHYCFSCKTQILGLLSKCRAALYCSPRFRSTFVFGRWSRKRAHNKCGSLLLAGGPTVRGVYLSGKGGNSPQEFLCQNSV